MQRLAAFVSVAALASLAPPLGAAVAVRVNNPYGDIIASVVDGPGMASDSRSRSVQRGMPLPEDTPVRRPSQAPAILEELLHGPSGKAKPGVRAPQTSPLPGTPAESPGLPVFTSDVRMVNLAVAITDAKGHPVTGLGTGDFDVVEDGVPQKLAFTGSEEVPFNLAILLDLSGSTRRNRPAMKEAARRFIEIARPQDRVAAYALANESLYIVSHLTPDRAQLRAAIEAIPEVSGGTPLYDAIVLSYFEEFHRRPGERNALIVISDGIDDQIQGTEAPSKSSFQKLRRAAAGMHALIYPVFLDPFDKVPPPQWFLSARQHLQQLADATGGRLFRARSAEDLEPVYPQVADELRSVYTVAYYPSNQNFDGTWRKVQVRLQRSGVRARTRAGYFAR